MIFICASNSPQKSQENFTVLVDRLTIMGDLDEKFLDLLQNQLQSPIFLLHKALTNRFTVEVSNIVYVDYDKFKAQAFNRRNMRMDFNPSHLSLTDKQMIWDIFVSKMTNRSFSRIDIAFDTYKDLTDYYILSDQALKETYIYGMNGSIETRYMGGEGLIDMFEYTIRNYS